MFILFEFFFIYIGSHGFVSFPLSSHLHRQLPRPMLLSSSRDSVRFYDPWNNRHFDLNLEYDERTRIWASYYGWFSIKTWSREDHRELYLFNPISRAHIHLPPMFHHSTVYLPLITSNPCSEDCFLLCHWHPNPSCKSQKLVFIRPGDCEWTVLDVKLEHSYAAHCNMKTYICGYTEKLQFVV